jgi:hypothetical protein
VKNIKIKINFMENSQSCCKCMCHSTIPVLIVLFGLTFLLKELGVVSASTANIVWPVIIILIGLKKIMKNVCKCCGVDKCCETHK